VSDRKPTQRDYEMVRDMLRQFRAAQETLLHSSDGGGDAKPWAMPRTWTIEMRELERCLGVLARRKPFLHRQVMSRYVDPVVSRRTMRGRFDRKAGVDVLVWPDLGTAAEVRTFAKLPEHAATNQYTCLIASWPSTVNKILVAEAVEFLVREFRMSSAVGPALPAEMLAA
jgi:hypothetical protein